MIILPQTVTQGQIRWCARDFLVSRSILPRGNGCEHVGGWSDKYLSLLSDWVLGKSERFATLIVEQISTVAVGPEEDIVGDLNKTGDDEVVPTVV
jgi:hypothetical protein